MLGMLVKVLRGDSIVTRRHLARKGSVTFEDLMRGTSDFDARTVSIEGLTSVRCLLPITVGIVTVIATMRSAGLSCSHDTGCIAIRRRFRARGSAARSSEITRVVPSQSSALLRTDMVTSSP
jgi:hypothetical protein